MWMWFVTALAHPTAAERAVLFQELVETTRAYHQFTPQTFENLGWRWEDDLPALERLFTDADTPNALSGALTAFSNAMHNPHVNFRAQGERPGWASLPARLDVEWIDGKAQFYVRRSSVSGLQRGDILRSVDGVSSAELIRAHSLASNANQLRGVAANVARHLAGRTEWTPLVGTTTEWVVSPRDKPRKKRKVVLEWAEPEEEPTERPSEHQIDYDDPSCRTEPDRTYGDAYRMTAAGRGWCLYTSSAEKERDWPVLRHYTYYYTQRGMRLADALHDVRSDHRLLKEKLAAADPKGVLIDLRDNGGGNNPHWFLDWWARQPYSDVFVKTRWHEDFADDAFREAHFDGWISARVPKEPPPIRTFFCNDEVCVDDHHQPDSPVTDRPWALMVGPGCVSSCDSFTRAVAANDMAPVVGVSTAAGYTTERLSWKVTTADGTKLGTQTFALSDELLTPDGPSIEAVPIPLDVVVEPTWENRDRYDRLLVEAAKRALTP